MLCVGLEIKGKERGEERDADDVHNTAKNAEHDPGGRALIIRQRRGRAGRNGRARYAVHCFYFIDLFCKAIKINFTGYKLRIVNPSIIVFRIIIVTE